MEKITYKCDRCGLEMPRVEFQTHGITAHQTMHNFHLCGGCRLKFIDWVRNAKEKT